MNTSPGMATALLGKRLRNYPLMMLSPLLRIRACEDEVEQDSQLELNGNSAGVPVLPPNSLFATPMRAILALLWIALSWKEILTASLKEWRLQPMQSEL